MEAFGYMSFIFAIVAISTSTALAGKVRKLERIVKSLNLEDNESSNLHNLLMKNIGKQAELVLEEGTVDFQIMGNQCLIKDVDTQWVHIDIFTAKGKHKGEKLLNIDTIKSVKFSQ